MIKELWHRHIIKTISWRVFSTLVLFIISLIVSGSFGLAGAIISIDIFIKTFFYYIHENVWSRISFGRTLMKHDGVVVWFTGLSGSGKTTLADAIKQKLEKRGLSVKRLDGDVARETFSKNLGFSKSDRDENNRRAAHVASYLALDNIVLASFISPYKSERKYARNLCNKFVEVYVNAPIDACEFRDPKGLYAKVRRGEIKSFTGMHDDAPYEIPQNPEYVVNTLCKDVNLCADEVIKYLEDNKYV